ncbi:MAM domain-containing glycosylphosphatidylinositol anchor protein 2-like [Pipra filicauda]|uniref:MAM domain-containing glycosylphosphatidylinositol anchor protein 2-like n=1 Tax=Pipra filicauda TaxID=649802 RepID=A0A7R5L356_9PASS|nr:MAM domain-containing glycosylphosphatidylinositol anchor protein 2-like [Pipra filicauda]
MSREVLLTWLLPVCVSPAPPTVRIVHSGLACNIEEERYSERVYTIREGETLELTCLVTGHPRPQIRWTKTAGSASDRFQDSSVFNETLRISNIQRHQGGRYYCKAENGLGSPAIKSIRVDVYYLDDPIVTVHQSIGEAKEQFYYEKTVFLRCVANSNPPVRYSWRRGQEVLLQGSDKGVEIYEPFFTQGETKILKLKNLRPQDYANYSCIASVRNVCSIPDKMVSFRLSNKTAPPSIKLLVDDPIVVNPGEAITLVCVTTGGEPGPSLTWVRSSGALPDKTVLNGGTLTIPAIGADDAGTYSCIANNNVGNPAKKSTNIIVRALKKGRFWITPDPYHKDDNIQIGREVKISCQVEAIPPEELTFSWFKNGRPLRSSERMVITQTDPDVSPGTTNLDIIDLKFTDFGTYTCVASLKGGGISDISIDVNISSSTVPPNLTVPQEKSPLVTREGDTIELQCQVTGKPKPIILWSRADKEVAMPDGAMQTESYDGILRIVNVSREMTGTYRCQTSQYNGFNVKPREALVQLIVQYPPAVEPTFLEIRQGQGRSVTMSCRVLRAYPTRVLTYEWRLGTKLLRTGQFDVQDSTDYTVGSLARDTYGLYNCNIINEAGAGRCSFLVTGGLEPRQGRGNVGDERRDEGKRPRVAPGECCVFSPLCSTACKCNGHASVCNTNTGKCFCTTKGIKGDECQLCEVENRYQGNPLKGTCYYTLLIDYQFTFSLSQEDDRYYTAINFVATPEEQNRDLDMFINASKNFNLNITWSTSFAAGTQAGEEIPVVSRTNIKEYKDSFSNEKFDFRNNPNITFFVYVSNFTWPIKIQIAFSQHSNFMDLVQFFVTFFSCFLSLLLVAAVVWKIKQSCWASRRREVGIPNAAPLMPLL